MLSLRAVIDVPVLEDGIAFYTRALQLQLVRHLPGVFAELRGAGSPIDLVQKDAGSLPYGSATSARDYARHWSPVHLDFVVDALDPVVARCVSLGARVEAPASEKKWGRIAILSDPFGHGLCVIQFHGRGYDEAF